MFGVLGLVIGAFVIGGIVFGGSSAQLSTTTGTPIRPLSTEPREAASATALSAAAPSPAPAATLETTTIPEPTPAPTPEPTTIPEPTPAPTPEPTLQATTEPTPIPTPTSTPESPTIAPTLTAQLGLTFDFPRDGEVLRDADINVIGRAPPGADVTRDVPMWFDDHTTVRDDGIWVLPIHLGEGANVLRFRIGDDRSTEQVLTVTYQP
jgi:hypothetical protein